MSPKTISKGTLLNVKILVCPSSSEKSIIFAPGHPHALTCFSFIFSSSALPGTLSPRIFIFLSLRYFIAQHEFPVNVIEQLVKRQVKLNYMESLNNTLRQHISRLARKTFFSKNVENHIGTIWYFIHNYNL